MEHWKHKAVTVLDNKFKMYHWMKPWTVNVEMKKHTLLVRIKFNISTKTVLSMSQLTLTNADKRFSSLQTLSSKPQNTFSVVRVGA